MDVPATVFETIGYYGDGCHYCCWKPAKESKVPRDPQLQQANQHQWREKVDVSGDAYPKVSPKPNTKNRVSKLKEINKKLISSCSGVLRTYSLLGSLLTLFFCFSRKLEWLSRYCTNSPMGWANWDCVGGLGWWRWKPTCSRIVWSRVQKASL